MLRTPFGLALLLLSAGCGSAASNPFDSGSAAGAENSAGARGANSAAGASGSPTDVAGNAAVAGSTASAGSGGVSDTGTAGSAGSSISSGGLGGSSGSAGSSTATAGTGGSTGSIAGNAGTGGTTGSAGSGAFAGAGGFVVWPGGNDVVTVDPKGTYDSNLSGLIYEPLEADTPAILWAVQNSPSKLYRLLWNGTTWSSDTSNGWGSGKTLHFPNGSGTPDSEGVTKLAFGTTDLYVSTERDGDNGAVSRLSVLSFDGSVAKTSLTATHEWNLTSDQPKVDPNLGLEGLAWIPDSYLVSKGFLDESTHAAYDPTLYANHAGGIFFVGVEQTGMIYGYALDHVGGGFTRVATIVSGQASVMELAFDRDVGYLWAVCDDSCKGRINVLDIDTRPASATRGKFVIRRGFERPSSMANLNNEGFTMATESTCVAGFKAVFYSDDDSDAGHAIRRDSIPCGPFIQ